MAATARVMWLCACVRYWPGRGLVCVYPLLQVCTIFKVSSANVWTKHEIHYLINLFYN